MGVILAIREPLHTFNHTTVGQDPGVQVMRLVATPLDDRHRAFEAFVPDYQDMVYSVAVLCCQLGRAEDLQTVFRAGVRALERWTAIPVHRDG